MHRFGWNDEGDALELYRHCLSQPEEPPAFRVQWGISGAGKSKMCCAKAQSDPKVLSAVLGDILPRVLLSQACPAVTEPIESCVQDVTGEGSEL